MNQSSLKFLKRLCIGGRIKSLCHQESLRRGQYRTIRLIHRHGILVFIDEKFSLIEFLVRFENAVLNHLQRTAGAFARPEIFEDKFFFTFPVVVECRIFVVRGNDCVGNQFILQLVLARTRDECGKAFVRLAIAPIDFDQVKNGRRHRLRG